MNRSLFSITRYMNRVCFKVSGGTSVPKLPPSYPPEIGTFLILGIDLILLLHKYMYM